MATPRAPNVRIRIGLQHMAQGGHETDQQSYIHVPYYSEDPDSNILFVLEGFISELLVLIEEFEATKRIMQGEKFVQCARLGTGLQGQLSDCLVALQKMASTLEQKVVPMQQLTAALKQADGHLQEQLSPVQVAQIQGLLLEMRSLCHKFSLKLRELRSLASRVLDLAFWRARNPIRVKTIKIDCSAVAVLVLFLLSVWASRLLPQLV